MKRCNCLIMDWPWQFKDRLPGGARGAAKHYDVMLTERIGSYPLPKMATDAILFFWRVGSQQREALDGIDALGGGGMGWVVKSEFVWKKRKPCKHCHGSGRIDRRLGPIACLYCAGSGLGARQMGMGHYVRNDHEVCLIATRGRYKVADNGVPSTFEAPIGRHSAKPDKFYSLVRRLTGPRAVRVELFARVERPGFSCYGNELAREHP